MVGGMGPRAPCPSAKSGLRQLQAFGCYSFLQVPKRPQQGIERAYQRVPTPSKNVLAVAVRAQAT